MTRQELQQLSKPERIEIILQQQGLIEQLQARVAELEDLVKRLSQPPKDASDLLLVACWAGLKPCPISSYGGGPKSDRPSRDTAISRASGAGGRYPNALSGRTWL